MNTGYEWGKLIYCQINIGMILLGAALCLRVLAVFRGFWASGYLGHLANQVFRDSLPPPLAPSLIGLGIIGLGALWQPREAQWSARLRMYLPKALHELPGGAGCVRAARS
jgi:hypothetical protein